MGWCHRVSNTHINPTQVHFSHHYWTNFVIPTNVLGRRHSNKTYEQWWRWECEVHQTFRSLELLQLPFSEIERSISAPILNRLHIYLASPWEYMIGILKKKIYGWWHFAKLNLLGWMSVKNDLREAIPLPHFMILCTKTFFFIKDSFPYC